MDNQQEQVSSSSNDQKKVLFQDQPHNKNLGKNIMDYLQNELVNCRNSGLTKQQQLLNYLKLKEKQQYLDAIQHYNKVLKIDPKNMFMLLQRSMNYSLTQQHDLCIKDVVNLKQIIGGNAEYFDPSKLKLFNQYFDQLIIVETDSLKFIQENRKFEEKIKSNEKLIKEVLQEVEGQKENIKEDNNIDLYNDQVQKEDIKLDLDKQKLLDEVKQYKELSEQFKEMYDHFQDLKAELFQNIYKLIKNIESLQITNEQLEMIAKNFEQINKQIVEIKKTLNINEVNQMELKQKTEEQKSNCMIF